MSDRDIEQLPPQVLQNAAKADATTKVSGDPDPFSFGRNAH